jgi:MFS family permease
MFALSPVFGILSDRLGRVPTIGIGQALLLASLITAAVGAESQTAVVVALILLGLGWSAATVAGSALIAESADPAHRTRTQGRADLLMSSVGAVGGALAGPVLALAGYSGLALVAMVLVVAVTAALGVRVLSQRAAAGTTASS